MYGRAAAAPKRPNVQMPDKIIPSNKILCFQNIPESVAEDQLELQFLASRSQLPFPFHIDAIVTSRNSSFLDTPTYYTRIVLSQPNEILRLWSFLYKGSAGVAAKDA